MKLRLEMAVAERGLRWGILKKVDENEWKLIKEGEYEVKGRKLLHSQCKLAFDRERRLLLVNCNGEWKLYDGFLIVYENKRGSVIFNCMGKGKNLKINLLFIRLLLLIMDIPKEDKIKMRNIISKILKDYLKLVEGAND